MMPGAGVYTLLVTLAAYAVFGTSRHVTSPEMLTELVHAMHSAGIDVALADARAGRA